MNDTANNIENNIVIVDDNVNNLNLLASILSRKNYKIRRAINGNLAMRSIQYSPPDLILLDINLPDISGYEVCSQLKNDPKTSNIPIIFISALSETLDKVKAFSVGGVDYICKPFEVDEVLARVEHQLALQSARNEIQMFNKILEQRVVERTTQLELTNQRLKVINQSLELEIAERRQVQSELRLLKSVVVNANDAVIIIAMAQPLNADSTSPQVIYVNEAFTRMTGYSAEEIVGENTHLLQGPNTSQEDLEKIYQAFKTCQPIQIELLSCRKDGSELWVDLNISPVVGDTDSYTHWVCIQRDITQRKLQEQEILRALEQERELNELKSRFVSTASHEFRTPLATIQSAIDLLEHYAHVLTQAEQQDYFQQIRTAIERMTSLMSDVLTLDKVGSGKLELKFMPLDLAQLCQELVTEIQLATKHKHNIDLRLECLHFQLCMSEKALRHIFLNLLSNAVKYSPEGGSINFHVKCGEKEVTFHVSDQGIGIPAEAQQRLFEPFFRASNAGGYSGTGLGLSIVKRLVTLYGGYIEVDSQVGMGTTFTVVLPLKEQCI